MHERQSEQGLMEKLEKHDQQHVLRWLDQLDEGGRERLLKQLAGLNYDRLQKLRMLIRTPTTAIAFGDVRPAPIERLPVSEEEMEAEQTIYARGRRALESGRVAMLTVAGGQGTRLGYDHPKGMYPISPLREKSLFELFAEQILAARRRYGVLIPWVLMTSPDNDAETRRFFADNDYFRLGEENVRFFAQQMNPILDTKGHLLRCEPDELLMGPDGHGGIFEAMDKSDVLDYLRSGGWDLLSYFQVDNPLVTVADERFLGHHVKQSADFSCKVIPKRDPDEGLGLAVHKSGRPAVVEYVDVPNEIASERLPSGKLRYRYGSIAIHIMDVPFAERLTAREGALPWHIAHKQYEIVNDEGERVTTDPEGCRKFERFVFDALGFAERCAFVEVRRDRQFAPVKNAEGEDSPQSARRLLQKMWLDWLKAAGAQFDPPADLTEPVIEISPLYAASAEQMKERFEPGREVTFPLLLEG